MLMTVNSSEEYQRILGFGGAFTDSATMNILNVSSKVQENLLRAYFSTEGNSVPGFGNTLYTCGTMQNTYNVYVWATGGFLSVFCVILRGEI